jgi:hypothetical protein
LRHLYPRAHYHLFEDPDVVARFRHDPQGFLDSVRLPAILDEIQNVPEVFNHSRGRLSSGRCSKGSSQRKSRRRRRIPDAGERSTTFRDQQGLEVDFIVPARGGGMHLIEAKSSRTITPDSARSIERLAAAWSQRPHARRIVQKLVVHRPPRVAASSPALSPGVQAVSWREFVARIAS